MLERKDLEDNRKEGTVIAKCEECSTDIMEWEDYYDLEGVALHEDCIRGYISQYKRYA